jgi:hypothetical protein
MCTGAVAVYALRICLGSRGKSKNRDKQLTHIVRVSTSGRLKLTGLQKSVMVVLSTEISSETFALARF